MEGLECRGCGIGFGGGVHVLLATLNEFLTIDVGRNATLDRVSIDGVLLAALKRDVDSRLVSTLDDALSSTHEEATVDVVRRNKDVFVRVHHVDTLDELTLSFEVAKAKPRLRKVPKLFASLDNATWSGVTYKNGVAHFNATVQTDARTFAQWFNFKPFKNGLLNVRVVVSTNGQSVERFVQIPN